VEVRRWRAGPKDGQKRGVVAGKVLDNGAEVAGEKEWAVKGEHG
jgi:hypothetical protein